jgi:hypothetical protein
VVAPQRHHGLPREARGVEGVEDAADVAVGVAERGPVRAAQLGGLPKVECTAGLAQIMGRL